MGAKCRGGVSWGTYMSWKGVVGSIDVVEHYKRQVSWTRVVEDIVDNKGVVEGGRGCKLSWKGVVGSMGTNLGPKCRGWVSWRVVVGARCRGRVSWEAWVQTSVPSVVDYRRGRRRGCMGTNPCVVDDIVGSMVTCVEVVEQMCRGCMSWDVSWGTWLQDWRLWSKDVVDTRRG